MITGEPMPVDKSKDDNAEMLCGISNKIYFLPLSTIFLGYQ
jgi:hypothetical protein